MCQTGQKILELGPSITPDERATAWLDRRFASEFEQKSQRCAEDSRDPEFEEKITFYDGGYYPFANMSFDYVLCSHVLEHIPVEDISLFIEEMLRVGPAGYVEVPHLGYEIFCNIEPHVTYIAFDHEGLLFLDKNFFPRTADEKAIMQMLKFMSRIINAHFEIEAHKPLFFYGFEWKKSFSYKIVDNFSELISPYFLETLEKECRAVLKILPAPDRSFWEKALRKIYLTVMHKKI